MSKFAFVSTMQTVLTQTADYEAGWRHRSVQLHRSHRQQFLPNNRTHTLHILNCCFSKLITRTYHSTAGWYHKQALEADLPLSNAGTFPLTFQPELNALLWRQICNQPCFLIWPPAVGRCLSTASNSSSSQLCVSCSKNNHDHCWLLWFTNKYKNST